MAISIILTRFVILRLVGKVGKNKSVAVHDLNWARVHAMVVAGNAIDVRLLGRIHVASDDKGSARLNAPVGEKIQRNFNSHQGNDRTRRTTGTR